MCALLDNYRGAVVALQTAAPADVVAAAYQFAEADREVYTALHALVDSEAPGGEAAEQGGWIKWIGGKRPVTNTTRIQIKLRSGETHLSPSIHYYEWRHFNRCDDIVAYRVVSE